MVQNKVLSDNHWTWIFPLYLSSTFPALGIPFPQQRLIIKRPRNKQLFIKLLHKGTPGFYNSSLVTRSYKQLTSSEPITINSNQQLQEEPQHQPPQLFKPFSFTPTRQEQVSKHQEQHLFKKLTQTYSYLLFNLVRECRDWILPLSQNMHENLKE